MDLKKIAQTTAGFTGADLENLMNEAAIVAAKADRAIHRSRRISRPFVKVGIGTEKKSKVISEQGEADHGLPRSGPCDPVPCAAGCGTGLFGIDHPDRGRRGGLHHAAAGEG